MSLALYRKYRPATFSDVIGQEHVTEPLKQALRSGRIHHAYLFSGPRGCGKTSSARILARSLNCVEGPTPDPCGECESCKALAPNGAGSLDVIEIDAASHGGVDDARDLRERAFFAPASSRFKIYIIDEAHMVSREGFNALLKLVEEPPAHLKFIFATTEPDKVIGTIRSRTHHYPFRLVPPGVLREFLAGICQKEGVAIDEGALPLVVRAGAGSVRDSLSVLDQLIAGSGPDGVTYAEAVSLLGFTDAAMLDQVVDAVAALDGAALFELVDRVMESGHDPRRFAADLLTRFRDLIVLQSVPDAARKGLIDVPGDQLERMNTQASAFGLATLSRSADLLATGLLDMRGATAPRLSLEIMCARLVLPAASTDPGALAQRIEQLERSGPPARPAATTPQPAPVPAPAAPATSETAAQTPPAPSQPAQGQPAQGQPAQAQPTQAATAPQAAPQSPTDQQAAAAPHIPAEPPAVSEPVPSGPLTVGRIQAEWETIKARVSAVRRTPGALLQYATAVGLEGTRLSLAFDPPAIGRTFQNGDAAEIIAQVLGQIYGGSWAVAVATAPAASPAPARTTWTRPEPEPAPVPPPAAAPAPAPTPAPVETAPAGPVSGPEVGAAPTAAPEPAQDTVSVDPEDAAVRDAADLFAADVPPIDFDPGSDPVDDVDDFGDTDDDDTEDEIAVATPEPARSQVSLNADEPNEKELLEMLQRNLGATVIDEPPKR